MIGALFSPDFAACSIPVDKSTFLRHLWATYNSLADKADEDAGKPAYFRFLTLLGFKIFLEAKVDVAILEVGLGGRLDATNCVRDPVVCGVTALGFDHVALLGNTLPQIAREKAGIFKKGRPAFTVPQPEDAEKALHEVATTIGTVLQRARPLDEYFLEAPGDSSGTAKNLRLGLAGEHQRQNASLAVALAAEWECLSPKASQVKGVEALRRGRSVHGGVLPAEYISGLQLARWPGRGQIIRYDPETGSIEESSLQSMSPHWSPTDSSSSSLTFFLDGAHTAESMVPCATWFADASAAEAEQAGATDVSTTTTHRVLLFNCMEVGHRYIM